MFLWENVFAELNELICLFEEVNPAKDYTLYIN